MDPRGDRPGDPGLAGRPAGASGPRATSAWSTAARAIPTWEYVTTAPAARLNLEALIDALRAERPHPPATRLPRRRRVHRDDHPGERLGPGSGPARRLMANPGSVGQPRDGDPRAERDGPRHGPGRAPLVPGGLRHRGRPRRRCARPVCPAGWSTDSPTACDPTRGSVAGRTGRRRRRRERSATWQRRDDRRSATAHRSQARRPARPGRPPALAVLPLHRPRPARRQGGGARPEDARSGGPSPAIRAIVFGRPLATEEEIGERLSKVKALAIFSSDAISSSAYATEEILRVLIVAAAAGALTYSIGVSLAIALLLTVVSLSYRQVCRAYPHGGGAYAVARENLAPLFGLIAAAALLIDYVMTVAVSTASAIQQLQSVYAADLRLPDRDRLRLDQPHHDRQPARPARVGQHLRDPDLRLRRPGPADRRDRRRHGSSAARPRRCRPSRTPSRRAPRP